MFGGAFGAYIVAKHQMDKEKEHYEEREIINARLIISCMEFTYFIFPVLLFSLRIYIESYFYYVLGA